jgi:hypothetical protein
MRTEYVCSINYHNSCPNDASWVAKLLELGRDRESFNLTHSSTGKPTVKFWEPDAWKRYAFSKNSMKC